MTQTEWRFTIGAVVLVGVLALAATVASLYFSEDHQRYVAFEAQRAAWHQRCDTWVDTSPATPEAKRCAAELTELMDYARRQGWR